MMKVTVTSLFLLVLNLYSFSREAPFLFYKNGNEIPCIPGQYSEGESRSAFVLPGNEEDTVVIVLDIQQHFTRHVIPDSSAVDLINTINSVIENTDPEKVIYVKSVLSVLTVSFKGIHVDTLPELDLDERLAIVNENIVTKNKPNAFDFKELNDLLEQRNAENIIVVGLMAEHCVYKTLTGGKKLGYNMFVIPGAICGKSAKSKTKVLDKLEKKGIRSL
ncbi:MAG: isochorismatase family protein [Bacteroidales bacterium]|jgi:nicotinamidase-related amidase